MSESEVRTSLLMDWDPVGMQGVPEFAATNGDEYDRYVSVLCAMLRNKPSQADLERYLCSVETAILGRTLPAQQTQGVARKLLSLHR